MKNIILIAFSLTLSFLVNAQDRETRNLASFDRLSVGESIELIIKEGDRNEAIVEASGADVEDVLTDVSGGKLPVHMARGSYRSTNIRVFLTYKKLNSIKVSSSASLKTESIVKTSELRVRVSSSGRAYLEAEVDELQIAVSSSGRLEMSGSARKQIVDASSSGRYSGYKLKSEILEADVSSSGRAEVFVTERLSANASSSGRVSYRGNPSKVIADSSSSGRVRRDD